MVAGESGKGGGEAYHAVHEAAETPEGVGVVLEDCVDYAEEVAHSLDIAYCQLRKEAQKRKTKRRWKPWPGRKQERQAFRRHTNFLVIIHIISHQHILQHLQMRIRPRILTLRIRMRQILLHKRCNRPIRSMYIFLYPLISFPGRSTYTRLLVFEPGVFL